MTSGLTVDAKPSGKRLGTERHSPPQWIDQTPTPEATAQSLPPGIRLLTDIRVLSDVRLLTDSDRSLSDKLSCTKASESLRSAENSPKSLSGKDFFRMSCLPQDERESVNRRTLWKTCRSERQLMRRSKDERRWKTRRSKNE